VEHLTIKLRLDLNCIPAWSNSVKAVEPGYTHYIDIPTSVFNGEYKDIRLCVEVGKEVSK